MLKKLLLSLTILLLVMNVNCEVRKYDNFQLLRVVPRSREALLYLHELAISSRSYLDFWTFPQKTNQNIDVLVQTEFQNEFKILMEVFEIGVEVLINNLQAVIDIQKIIKSENRTDSPVFDWNQYHNLDEIYNWMAELVVKYPGKVRLEKGGTSYEGRDILGVHLKFSPGNENRSVFVESNIHACEWIGSAVSTYILNQLLSSTNQRVRSIADIHDWYFFPVLNPDGFVYTHETDRIWRKNRRIQNGHCVGTDLNRNWGYHFNEGGASDDPCSEFYNGPEAFSEPETRSVSEYVEGFGDQLVGYISFHSYGQILLLPYGYTAEHMDNYDELYEVGKKAIDKLSQRFGTQYRVGDVAEIMYVASGGSPDWIKGTFNPRITYTYELRDTGNFGFLLPAEQIIPTAEETFDSFLTIFEGFP